MHVLAMMGVCLAMMLFVFAPALICVVPRNLNSVCSRSAFCRTQSYTTDTVVLWQGSHETIYFDPLPLSLEFHREPWRQGRNLNLELRTRQRGKSGITAVFHSFSLCFFLFCYSRNCIQLIHFGNLTNCEQAVQALESGIRFQRKTNKGYR